MKPAFEPFLRFEAAVVPLDRANIDTDAILPKQFMKSIRRDGFGVHLFDEWRFLDRGEPGKDHATRVPNPGFPLNEPRYATARILLARENFGCGSSREHAVWALRDFGIRALIAPSYADIFKANCTLNGVLPVVLDASAVNRLFVECANPGGASLTIDLPAQTVELPTGEAFRFDIDAMAKRRLVEGLDQIVETLEHADSIREYERRRRELEPWLFTEGSARQGRFTDNPVKQG